MAGPDHGNSDGSENKKSGHGTHFLQLLSGDNNALSQLSEPSETLPRGHVVGTETLTSFKPSRIHEALRLSEPAHPDPSPPWLRGSGTIGTLAHTVKELGTPMMLLPFALIANVTWHANIPARHGCSWACGLRENREDGANPSRSRRCIRGRTPHTPLSRDCLGRRGARTIREPEDLPKCRFRSFVLPVVAAIFAAVNWSRADTRLTRLASNESWRSDGFSCVRQPGLVTSSGVCWNGEKVDGCGV